VPSNVTAICPGTFDPVTVGHLDIITRGAHTFRRVVVGLIEYPVRKQTMFTPTERAEFLRQAVADYPNVYVDRFNELVVEFARRWQANVILKGLRAISDFEYEFAMAQLNRKLAPDIETIFMMASPQHAFLSSSGVKEIATFGGSVDDLVPPAVARRFAELFPRKA
jgi:pantetheine-phosphate adenylyltransferase